MYFINFFVFLYFFFVMLMYFINQKTVRRPFTSFTLFCPEHTHEMEFNLMQYGQILIFSTRILFLRLMERNVDE